MIVKQIIDGVNRLINSSVAYQRESGDIWQSLSQTLELGTGDCEDFAIAKMALLLNVVPPRELKLAYVISKEGEPHMVLCAGEYLLDNLNDELILMVDSGYKPVYQIDALGCIYDNKDRAIGTSELLIEAL